MGKLEYSHLKNAGAVVENNKIPPSLYLKELRCFGSAMKSHSRGTSGVSKKPTAGKG